MELLKWSEQLSKNPEEYANPNEAKKELGEKLGLRKGQVLYYFKRDKTNEDKRSYTLDPNDVSIKQIKQFLWERIRVMIELKAPQYVDTIVKEILLLQQGKKQQQKQKQIEVNKNDRNVNIDGKQQLLL
jgi:hypothetical protein